MPWITIPFESFHKRISIGKMSRNDDRKSCSNVIEAARGAPAQHPMVQARRTVDYALALPA